jgi:glycosyltransferase involved in cell wall biosynthesis
MTDFPRLLVATEFPPNSPGGGGAVIRQMLKDWPAANLFWWSCSPDPGNLFGRKVAQHSVAAIPPKLYPNRRWAAQKSWLLDAAWVPWAARHLKKTLTRLKPDVVWAIPHCWSIPPLARVLPQAGIAFHISIHDYMDHQAMVTRFGAGRARKMAAMADQLYTAATTRDAICRAMADDLRSRTGREGFVNHAGLEQEDFDYLSGTPPSSGSAIRIAYAGTIIAQKTFVAFIRALEQIRHQLPLPVTLDFFGDHSYRTQEWFAPNWMKEHGNLDAAGLSRALKECIWGFAPMELTDDNPRYNRFSLPTKFVSYLAAGLPIITVGHPESTVVKVASQHNVGLCATSAEAFDAQLRTALSEANPQSKYRTEILSCALAEFDARRMRAILYENFQKCAAASR